MPKVPPASGKKEARPKTLLIGKNIGNGTGNSGFASASDSIEPKDTRTIEMLTPTHDLLDEIDLASTEAHAPKTES